MQAVPEISAIPSTQPNNKTSISRPLSTPLSTPLSFIDTLKLKFPKFPIAGQMGGSGTQFSDLPGMTTVSNFTGETESPIVGNTNVPEFLYQLIKMLTDNHREVIEWSNGKIEVHNPHKLESDVLNKYFRHSKYASFQRQLNYFGFRKLAGKGKMAPCSYVNELATTDLRSLLKMKRKTSATTKETKSDRTEEPPSSEAKPKIMQCSPFQKSTILNPTVHGVSNNVMSSSDRKRSKPCTVESNKVPRNVAKFAVGKGIRHSFNGYLKSNPVTIPPSNIGITSTLNNPLLSNPVTTTTTLNTPQQNFPPPTTTHTLDPQSIARSVVGKGVQHQFATHPYQQTQGLNAPTHSMTTTPTIDTTVTSTAVLSNDVGTINQKQNHPNFLFLDPNQLGMGVEDSLNELQNNYRNSLNDSRHSGLNDNNGTATNGKMERVSSLVNLAMIPDLDSLLEPVEIVSTVRSPEEEAMNSMAFIDFPSCDFDPGNPNPNLNPTITYHNNTTDKR